MLGCRQRPRRRATLWIFIPLLIGRVAAIVGILLQSRIGWWMAVGFFAIIVGLNGWALAYIGTGIGVLRLAVPLACLIYLITLRSEFE